MSVPVHILCTVRNPQLLPATLMVFDSLRVGFPKAVVTAHLNCWEQSRIWEKVMGHCNNAKVDHTRIWPTVKHHEWILALIEHEASPFWICDTDIVFFDQIFNIPFDGCALAGRYIPQFYCQFAKAITRPRLHGSLLYLDPAKIKAALDERWKDIPACYALPKPTLQELVFPRYVPHAVGSLDKKAFYDTCAGLFHAIGGQRFTDAQNDSFGHLGSSTLVDVVSEHYSRGNLREWHASVLDQPHLLKGQWQRDQEFYRQCYCE